MNKLDSKSKKKILMMLRACARDRERAKTLESQLLETREENDELRKSATNLQGDAIEISKRMVSSLKSVLRVFHPLDRRREPPVAVQEISFKDTPQTDEQNLQLRQNIEKMGALLKEKEKRIAELLQYEYGAKKAIEQKLWQQEELEKERMQVKLLEKVKESQLSTLAESRQHAQQLERAVEFLQKRNEELTLEKNQLQESALEAEASIGRLSFERDASSSERDALEELLKKETNLTEEMREEIEALHMQFGMLKKTVESQKQNIHHKTAHSEELHLLLKATEEDRDALRESLLFCENEMGAIKQHLMKGGRDLKELENRFSEAITEKLSTIKSLHQLQREFDKQNSELMNIKDKLRMALEREIATRADVDATAIAAKNRIITLEMALKKQHTHYEALEHDHELLIIRSELVESERDRLKENAYLVEVERKNLNSQHQQLNEQLSNALEANHHLTNKNEEMLNEIEGQRFSLDEQKHLLDEAHQHLAKKVREASLLQEKVDELLLQMADLEAIHLSMQETTEQLKHDFERGESERAALEGRIPVLELEIKRLEEKYVSAETRAQHALEKVAELEKIEKCHAQLQGLLSGIGVQSGYQQAAAPKPQQATRLQFGEPLPEEEDENNTEIAAGQGQAYANLFDLPTAQSRPKQTLFD